MWRRMNAATLSSVESAGRVEGAGAGPTVFRYGTCEPEGLFGRPPAFTQLRARQGNRAARIGVWHRLPSTAPNITDSLQAEEGWHWTQRTWRTKSPALWAWIYTGAMRPWQLSTAISRSS